MHPCGKQRWFWRGLSFHSAGCARAVLASDVAGFFCESDIERFYIFPEVEAPGFSTTSWVFAGPLRVFT